VSTRHDVPPTNTGTVFKEDGSSGSVGQGLGECHGVGMTGGKVVGDHLTGLKLKLEELEGEKRELDLRKGFPEEDIQTLKRGMQLVPMLAVADPYYCSTVLLVFYTCKEPCISSGVPRLVVSSQLTIREILQAAGYMHRDE